MKFKYLAVLVFFVASAFGAARAQNVKGVVYGADTDEPLVGASVYWAGTTVGTGADAEIQDAVKAKEEAEVMKAEYEKNMQEAKEKANDIVLTAQKTAAVQSEEMLKEASSQVTAMKEKAEKDIAQERRKAVNGIKGEIGGMAVEIAGKVIEREINEEDHTKLINDFIENVGEAS